MKIAAKANESLPVFDEIFGPAFLQGGGAPRPSLLSRARAAVSD